MNIAHKRKTHRVHPGDRVTYLQLAFSLIVVAMIGSPCSGDGPGMPTGTESVQRTKVVAPAAPNASPATRKVLEYFYSLTSRRDKRVVSGQFLDHGTQASLDEVAEVHHKTGKWVGMVGGDYYGRDDPPDVTDSSWCRDANWKETNPILIDYWKQGGLVTLCLHAFNPQSGKSAWIRKNGDTINLTDVITPGRPGHKVWMRQLDLIAEGLQELKDEGVVVLFRPFHEMSGHWFWWGTMNTRDEFVNLWKHMFDYFTYTRGLDNLLWYYCPGSRTGGVMDFYPGDEYVDLVGVDYYGNKNSGRNIADIRRKYIDLTATGKPFGLGETGPYSGINFLENPPDDYDYGKFIRDIKKHLPLCTSFMIWHQHHGLQFQKNAQECLDDPWTINRADIHIHPAARGAIDIYSTNPFYWAQQGRPILLLGGSGDDNLFQWAGARFADKLFRHLDLLVSVGGNYVRNTMSSRYDACHGYNDKHMAYPFRKLVSGKYDLDKWDDDYWRRLERFLEATHARGIVVQLELWDRDAIIDKVAWSRQPWNPDLNVNYTYETAILRRSWNRGFFEAVTDAGRQGVLRNYQDRYVRRILAATLRYDHVLYQINNESPLSAEISDYWAAFVHREAAARGRSVHVCDSRRFHAPSPYVTKTFCDWRNPDVHYPILHPRLYTFCDLSQNGGNVGQTHYDNLLWYRSRLQEHMPRPINHVKIYKFVWPTGGAWTDRLPGESVYATRRFWRTIFGGAAGARHHRDKCGFGLGLSPRAQADIRSMRRLTDAMNIFVMTPDNSVLSARAENEAYALVEAGRQYAIYFTGVADRCVKLDISATTGTFVQQWLDIEHSTSLPETTIRGGRLHTLTTPRTGQWAVLIKRAANQ